MEQKLMESYWDLVEPVWEKVSIYDGPIVFLNQYAECPKPSRVLLAAHWLYSEVCNGGFTQFFDNGTGVLAPEAVQSYRELGMPKTAAVIEKAMAMLGTEYPRDREVRWEALENIGATFSPDSARPFESLDSEFYQVVETESGGFLEAADQYAKRWSVEPQ